MFAGTVEPRARQLGWSTGTCGKEKAARENSGKRRGRQENPQRSGRGQKGESGRRERRPQ
eukprot:8185876-Heterocapsa_arctica.AAC.1